LAACSGAVSAPTPFPTPQILTVQRSEPTSTDAVPTEIAGTPTTSPTPDVYSGLTIDDLANRQYGGGEFLFDAGEHLQAGFTRYVFEYPSDGLLIQGFMNLPDGEGPHPVVLVLHGYIDPKEYELLPYTTRYADVLASAGYLVLHPNYRNYPLSDLGPNPFRIGYAVDVMNLIALVREHAGRPGPLASADPDAIGLFGHSMGGGITLRIIVAEAPVQAAVLYGSMSADELRNFEMIYEWSEGARGLAELNTPPQDLARISPQFYLDRIQVPVSIHHGAEDELVPPEWSEELCQQLEMLGKSVECFSYENEPHTFIGFGGIVLMDRTAAFFSRYLRASD
jgi:dipeptidyl aminopeptidase/acylaminoacyl peptidase